MFNRQCACLLFVALLIGWAARVAAQEADVTTVPWAYSAYFGTGWDEIGDERDAFAIRYVYRKRLREPALEPDGRRIGLELRVPVTMGLDQFPLEDVAGSVDPENFANLSVNPGLWLDVPVTRRFTLRPFVAAGWGAVLNGDDSAWTYWGGVHSRFLLTEDSPRLALINSVGFVGYTPQNGASENFLPLVTALELRHPFVAIRDGKDRLRLHWHAAHTHFHGQLDLNRPGGVTEKISEQWEAGIAVSRQNGRLRLGWLSFDRFGFAYRFSSDGQLEGIGLVFNSLFDE